MFTRAQLPPDRRPARVASGRAGLAVVGDLAGLRRWPEIWRDGWCCTELGGTADAARNRPDLYVRNGNAQMANSGNGQGKWARRREKPASRRPPVVCASWGT